jgi:uncharacterized protein
MVVMLGEQSMSDQTHVWTAESILSFLREHRTKLRSLDVQEIGLFGSYIRGEQKPDSDIDILVTIDNFTFAKYAELWDFLEDNFGCKVDLVPEPDLRPQLRPYILPEVVYVEGL